jgi:hypothetical protein
MKSPHTTDSERLTTFLWGFAKGANIDRSEADQQWAAWSRQLGDAEREAAEKDGEDSGFAEGIAFARFHAKGAS